MGGHLRPHPSPLSHIASHAPTPDLMLTASPPLRRSFSRDLTPLDADGNATKKKRNQDDSSSEESSDEESSDDDDPRARIGQLPPIEDSESEDDSGLVKNINSTLATTSLTEAEAEAEAGAAPAKAPSAAALLARSGAPKTADEIAQARKDRKAAAQAGKPAKQAAPGSGSDSEAEGNANKTAGKAVKLSELGKQPLSRREKEQADKKAAQERYAKLHAAGKVSTGRWWGTAGRRGLV